MQVLVDNRTLLIFGGKTSTTTWIGSAFSLDLGDGGAARELPGMREAHFASACGKVTLAAKTFVFVAGLNAGRVSKFDVAERKWSTGGWASPAPTIVRQEVQTCLHKCRHQDNWGRLNLHINCQTLLHLICCLTIRKHH